MQKSKRQLMRSGRQSGATAIEFALLFPALFLVIYGGITYGYIFFLQQRINFAAQEGVRAAIALDPAAPGYTGSIATAAMQAVINTFTGGGGVFPAGVSVNSGFGLNCGAPPAGGTPPAAPVSSNIYTVCVQYNLMSPQQLFPTLDFSLLNIDIAVPGINQLVARATGRLS